MAEALLELTAIGVVAVVFYIALAGATDEA